MEVRSRLLEFLNLNPHIEQKRDIWLQGTGWDQNLWSPPVFPTKDDLDTDIRLASVPICLKRIDYHAIWLNGLGLEKAAPHLSSASGPDLIKDSQGRLTGVILDDAMDVVEKTILKKSDSDLKLALALVFHEMVKYGLTSVHDAGLSPKEISFLKKAVDDNLVPVKIYAMVLCPDQSIYCGDQITKYDNYKNRLTTRSVKLIMDGALGSWGALMLKQYDDHNSTGLQRLQPKNSISGLMDTWMKNGFQVNVHCIGDLANRLILDAFNATKVADLRKARSRIEHAQIVDPNDVPRFSKLGIIPSVQPSHCISDMSYADSRLGSRAKTSYLWKSFLKSGVSHLPLGSDFPVELVNPLIGFSAAVFRMNSSNKSWYPDQRITRSEALKGYTLDAAYASFQEERTGSIKKGKFADFVVFTDNFMNDEVQDITNSKVLCTVIDGKVAYGSLHF